MYKKQQFSQVYAVTVITNSVYRQRQLHKTTSEFTEKKEKKEKKNNNNANHMTKLEEL